MIHPSLRAATTTQQQSPGADILFWMISNANLFLRSFGLDASLGVKRYAEMISPRLTNSLYEF